MTEVQTFVALRAFRFGTTALQIGDPVPVEAGRDYRLMQRLGQIGPASTTVPAGPQEEPLLTPYEEGSTVVFVAEDGTYVLVKFLDAIEAPEEVRDGMGLKDGEVVASVVFPEDPDNATFVSMASLLPEQPTGMLIDGLKAQSEAAQEEANRLRIALASAEDEGGAALAQVSTLTTEAQEGEKALSEARAKLEILRAAPVLPPDALKRITDVKGVGEKLAPVILAALTAQPEPAAPEATPEG